MMIPFKIKIEIFCFMVPYGYARRKRVNDLTFSDRIFFASIFKRYSYIGSRRLPTNRRGTHRKFFSMIPSFFRIETGPNIMFNIF